MNTTHLSLLGIIGLFNVDYALWISTILIVMIMNNTPNLAVYFLIHISLFEFIEHKVNLLFDILIALECALFPDSAIC